MSCCPSCCPCLCFSMDEEKQKIGCILFHYQCGCCPCLICDYDNNAMCWGCICCEVQIDPCWMPRGFLKCFCALVPCGCIAQETIMTICCCNPGRATPDERVTQEKVDKKVEQAQKDKK